MAVGYGEVRPVDSPALRGLTIGVIVAGYGAAIYTVGGFVQLVTEGEISRALGSRRMTKEVRRLTDHAIVCGFGRIGRILATELAAAGQPFIVLDTDRAKVQEADAAGYLSFLGNAEEEEVLLSVGIERAQVLATVLPNDAANVFITLTASGLNPNLRIIARGENPETEKKLLRSGATQVVLPAAIGAVRMAHLITCPSAESLLGQAHARAGLNNSLSEIGLRLVQLHVGPGSPLVGRTLEDIEIRSNQGFLIVALARADGAMTINPATELVLAAGDSVIVLGHTDDTAELADRYRLDRTMTYRGVAMG